MALTPAATLKTTADTVNDDGLAARIAALETAFNEYAAGQAGRGVYAVRFKLRAPRQSTVDGFVASLQAAGYLVRDLEGNPGPFEPGTEVSVSYGSDLEVGYAMRFEIPGGSDFQTVADAVIARLVSGGYTVVDEEGGGPPFAQGVALKVTPP